MSEETRSSLHVGLPVAVVLAGLIIAAALYVSREGGQLGARQPGDSPQPSLAEVAAIEEERVEVTLEETDPVLGEDSAPVTMIEFSDFECSYCRTFQQATLPKLRQRYIDTGKVRLIHKDFPLSQIHPQAQVAAEAARCAQEQDTFWPYAEILYAKQPNLSETDLLAYAGELKLDARQFETCLEAHTYAERVAAAAQTGIGAGVTGTPAFVINGVLVEGALPEEVFVEAIEAALATPAPSL